MKKILLVQTAIADYRDKFIEEVRREVEARGDVFKILVGDEYFYPSTRTSERVKGMSCTLKVRNIFLLSRRLLVQPLPMRAVLGADVVVGELNPRIISTWLIVLARKLLGKRTVLWGHAWSRCGPTSRTDRLRGLLRNLADALLLYTESQRRELRERKCRARMLVAPNSIYRRDEIGSVFSPSANRILYVGRLVADKKVELLMQGASMLLLTQKGVRLGIVGEGPEMDALKQLARDLEIVDKVDFLGHVADHSALQEIYRSAFVSVSPGYVGLSITQSLSFGVPMLVARDEDHSPELEALRPGFNGDFFESNDAHDLANKLTAYFARREEIGVVSHQVADDCAERYSVENMARGFLESLD